MGWSLLIIVVAASTAIWPVGRWALKDKVRPLSSAFGHH